MLRPKISHTFGRGTPTNFKLDEIPSYFIEKFEVSRTSPSEESTRIIDMHATCAVTSKVNGQGWPTWTVDRWQRLIGQGCAFYEGAHALTVPKYSLV